MTDEELRAAVKAKREKDLAALEGGKADYELRQKVLQKREMMANVDKVTGPWNAVQHGLGNMLTGGWNDQLGAAIFSPFMGYENALEQAQTSEAQAQEEYPMAYATGQGLGLVGPMKGGQALEQAILNLGAKPWQASTAAGSGIGYAEGSGQENVSDLWSTIIGGTLGAAGSAGTGVVKRVKDIFSPSETRVSEELGTQLFGETATRAGGLTPEDLIARRQELGPGAIGADLHPALRTQVAKSITEGASDEAIGRIATATEARDLPVMADESFLDVFGDPSTRTANRQARKAARADLSTRYEEVLQHNDATPTIDMRAVQGAITNAFEAGVTPVGTRKSIVNRVQGLVNQKGMVDAEGTFGRDAITLRDAVDLQHELDAMIAAIPADTTKDPALAVNKLVRADLIEARRNLSELLKSSDDDFRVISAQYAGENEISDAGRMAQQVFSSPNMQLAGDTAAYYNQLSEAAQEQFRAVAVYEIARKSAGTSGVSAVNRASGTNTGDAMSNMVRVVFGDKVANRLLAHADTLGTTKLTNEAVSAARLAREGEAVALGEAGGPLKSAADLATMIAQGATGRLSSGPFMGSARRGIGEISSRAPAAVNTARVNLGAMGGDDLEAELYRLYLMSRPQPAQAGLNFGVLGGPLTNE